MFDPPRDATKALRGAQRRHADRSALRVSLSHSLSDSQTLSGVAACMCSHSSLSSSRDYTGFYFTTSARARVRVRRRVRAQASARRGPREYDSDDENENENDNDNDSGGGGDAIIMIYDKCPWVSSHQHLIYGGPCWSGC